MLTTQHSRHLTTNPIRATARLRHQHPTPQPVARLLPNLRGLEHLLTRSSDCLLLVRPDGAVLPVPCPRRPVLLSGAGVQLEDYLLTESYSGLLAMLQTAAQTRQEQTFTARASLDSQLPGLVEVRISPFYPRRRHPVLVLHWSKIGGANPSIFDLLEHERRQIGQKLQDGFCQNLHVLTVAVENLSRELLKHEIPSLAGQVVDLAASLERLLGQAHDLSKGCLDDPTQGNSLLSSLCQFAADASARFDRPCTVTCHHSPPILPPETVAQLYRIVQEAVGNAIHHGAAPSVQITLERTGKTWQLSICDHGHGFQILEKTDANSGIGLRSMILRARHIGAALTIHSQPGSGTLVTCKLPV